MNTDSMPFLVVNLSLDKNHHFYFDNLDLYYLFLYFCSMKHRVWIVFLFSLAVCVACQHSGKEDMRLRLDYVSRCNRADTVFTEAWLPRVDSLVSYFDRHGNANERMMAHYLQGRVYHDMGEAPQALECYLRAAELTDTTRADCDLHTFAAIYGQMADLYHSQYLPDDEMKALMTAERIAWKDRDTIMALKAYELRIRPYHQQEKKDSMLYIMKDVRERYLRFGYHKEAAKAIYPTINILLDRQQINEARSYLDIYEKGSGNFDGNGELIYGGFYYYDKGRYLLVTGHVDSALFCFNKALKRGEKEAGYKGILSAYQRKHIPDSIAKYAELFAAANDSSFLHVNQERIRQISAMYDYNRHQRIAEKKDRENKEWRMGVMFIILSSLLVIAFIAYGFSHFKAEKLKEINQLVILKSRLEELLRKKERDIERISNEKQEGIRLIREQADAEINRLNAEHQLRIKKIEEERLADIAKVGEGNQAQLEEVINKLSAEKDQEIQRINEERQTEVMRLNNKNARLQRTLKEDTNRLRLRIEILNKRLLDKSSEGNENSRDERVIDDFKERFHEYSNSYVPPTQEDWQKLLKAFQNQYADFYIFITSLPNMKKDQIYICMMIRLDFPERMMAEALNIDSRQVDRKKRQINKKLFREDNASTLRKNLSQCF